MKSPFPGMDPYLETHWLDVHTSLISQARDALNESLPDDLIASAEERIAVESETGQEHTYGPDVRIFEPPATQTQLISSATDPEASTTYRLLAQIEPATERFIRVIEAGSERLVTVIEFISPANKTSPGLAAFRTKRAEILASGASFVEIDLVRRGDWRLLLRPHRWPKADTAYRFALRIASDPAAVHFHPIELRHRLPAVPIPLRHGDPQVELDLQTLVDKAYATGRYTRRIDYRRPCSPPLSPEDAAWAASLLASQS